MGDIPLTSTGRVLSLAAVGGLLLAMTLSQCTACEEPSDPPTTEGPPAGHHMIGDVPIGTVEGVIRFAEGAEIPSYAESPFATASAGHLPAACTPPQIADRQPLRLGAARGLANVAVAAMGDPMRWIERGEPVTREVHIRDCRLDPPTIVATLGDQIRIVNEVDYPFMPQFGLGFLQAVTTAEPLVRELDQGGPRALECAFAAPCGRAEIMVFQTPVHSVSGEDGTFRIENAPAGQELTLVAWHPLIAEAQATVQVEEGGTVHVEIVVHPLAPAAATPPSAPTPPSDPTAPSEPTDPSAPVLGTAADPVVPPASGS